MSSPFGLRAGGLATLLAVLALAAGGCGADDEPSSEVADRAPALDEEGTSEPSLGTSTAEIRTAPAAGERTETTARRKRAQRRRERRERERTSTTPPATSEQSAPAAEPSTPPAEPAEPAQEPKRVRPKPPAEQAPPAHAITETATLRLVRKEGLSFIQEGPVQGTLSGQMRLNAKIAGQGVEASFVVTLPDGTLSGSASASVTLDSSRARARFSGTATVDKGTGAYKRLVPASGLRFSGSVAADGSDSNVRLSGELRY